MEVGALCVSKCPKLLQAETDKESQDESQDCGKQVPDFKNVSKDVKKTDVHYCRCSAGNSIFDEHLISRKKNVDSRNIVPKRLSRLFVKRFYHKLEYHSTKSPKVSLIVSFP